MPRGVPKDRFPERYADAPGSNILESVGVEAVTESPEKPAGESLSELQDRHDEELPSKKPKPKKKKPSQVVEPTTSLQAQEMGELFESFSVDICNALSEGMLQAPPLARAEEHMIQITTKAYVMSLDEEDLKKAPGMALLGALGVVFVPRVLDYMDRRKASRSKSETA
jgi:hypothetical protein